MCPTKINKFFFVTHYFRSKLALELSVFIKRQPFSLLASVDEWLFPRQKNNNYSKFFS